MQRAGTGGRRPVLQGRWWATRPDAAGARAAGGGAQRQVRAAETLFSCLQRRAAVAGHGDAESRGPPGGRAHEGLGVWRGPCAGLGRSGVSAWGTVVLECAGNPSLMLKQVREACAFQEDAGKMTGLQTGKDRVLQTAEERQETLHLQV